MNALFLLFKKQIQRESLLHFRQPHRILYASLFFLMLAIFFPLALPFNESLLHEVAPGLVWMAVLLSLFLSYVGLFEEDYDQGVIEQWSLSGYPIALVVLAKILIHWVFIAFSFLLFSPLLAILYSFTPYETLILFLSLLAGTPAISMVCGLTASFSDRGILMALILLPLTLPIMIFGSGALTAAFQGGSSLGHLAVLLAISLIAVGFLPFAIAAILRYR